MQRLIETIVKNILQSNITTMDYDHDHLSQSGNRYYKDNKVGSSLLLKDQVEVTIKKEIPIKMEQEKVKEVSVKVEESSDITKQLNLFEVDPPELKIFVEKEELRGQEFEVKNFVNMSDSPVEEDPLKSCAKVEIKPEDFEFQSVGPSTSTGNLNFEMEYIDNDDSFQEEKMNFPIANDDTASQEDPLELNVNMQEEVMKNIEEDMKKRIQKYINKKPGNHFENHCELKYKCGYCFKVFEYYSHLSNHLLVHKDKKLLNTKSYSLIKNLKDQLGTHAGEKSEICMNTCGNCQKTFFSLSDFKRHVEKPTCRKPPAEKPFTCEHCQKSFPYKSLLKRHLLFHKTEKPYTCEYCQKSFPWHTSLKTHLKTHTGENQFKCGDCQKSFNRLCNLKTHMRLHTGEKPFTCDYCQKSFSHRRRWKYHLGTHTRTRENRLTCEHCQKSLANVSSLKSHLRTHTGERPYTCEHCQKSFSQHAQLKTHIRTHTKEKPFTCKYCQKSFSVLANWTVHLRIHTGEKPFTCEHCQRSFSWLTNLKRHLVIHTGKKSFTCEECQKSFFHRVHLNTHFMRMHTKENPFTCLHCQKSFSDRFALRYHVSTHTGE